MDVRNAVTGRRSVRAFLEKDVPMEAIRGVLERAIRSPSGGNLQPWNLHVIGGQPLARLKALMREKTAAGLAGEDPPAYQIYPRDLKSPYRDRRFAVGEAMYAALGIPREDKPARMRWFANNFQLFGAPLGIFISVDRDMGAPQWADLGIMMQTIMLLLRAEGIESCPQECWALYPTLMSQCLSLPENHLIFAGIAVGYADWDAPVNGFAVERASIEELVSFIGC